MRFCAAVFPVMDHNAVNQRAEGFHKLSVSFRV